MYKTEKERLDAFDRFCRTQKCAMSCNQMKVSCLLNWLGKEVEKEKPEPCPFCGSATKARMFGCIDETTKYAVRCESCFYTSLQSYVSKEDAIKIHNNLCRKLTGDNSDKKTIKPKKSKK